MQHPQSVVSTLILFRFDSMCLASNTGKHIYSAGNTFAMQPEGMKKEGAGRTERAYRAYMQIEPVLLSVNRVD